jgi:twitching motility protein PilT
MHNPESEDEEKRPNVDVHRLLQTMVEQGASDLHLTADSPPQLRINGSLFPLRTPPLSGADVEAIAYSVLNERQKKQFEETNEVDLSFQWKGASRFRANFFRQRGQMAGALRMIPFETRPLAGLGFPKSVSALVDKSQGLVLVTGATGSGKSTTLASIIDAINSRHRHHIITIEDPIEFVHGHKKSIVNQREIGTDTSTFSEALRYVLRQDPDVVLIGEIRDYETMEAALRIAETGHLAFATLHTNSTIQTIHRVLDFFPPKHQEMVRTQLSFVLEAVISQQLLVRPDGKGRALACEVLLPNAAIRNLIREEKTHQIYSQMQMGQGTHGMMTMNQSLFSLVQSHAISRETAFQHSHDVEELNAMFNPSATSIPKRR